MRKHLFESHTFHVFFWTYIFLKYTHWNTLSPFSPETFCALHQPPSISHASILLLDTYFNVPHHVDVYCIFSLKYSVSLIHLCITTCIFNLAHQNPAARQIFQCYTLCSNICYTFTDTSCACLHCTHAHTHTHTHTYTHIHTRTNHKLLQSRPFASCCSHVFQWRRLDIYIRICIYI